MLLSDSWLTTIRARMNKKKNLSAKKNFTRVNLPDFVNCENRPAKNLRQLQICTACFFFYFSFCVRFCFCFSFSFSFSFLENTCRIMVGCRSCTFPKIHLFMALNLKIPVGCRSFMDPRFLVRKTCTYVLDFIVRTAKKWGAVARLPVLTRVAVQANHSFPDTRKICAHVSTPWSVFRDAPEKVACATPWSMFQAG